MSYVDSEGNVRDASGGFDTSNTGGLGYGNKLEQNQAGVDRWDSEWSASQKIIHHRRKQQPTYSGTDKTESIINSVGLAQFVALILLVVTIGFFISFAEDRFVPRMPDKIPQGIFYKVSAIAKPKDAQDVAQRQAAAKTEIKNKYEKLLSTPIGIEKYFDGCKVGVDCIGESFERHAKLKVHAKSPESFWSDTCRINSRVPNQIAGIPVNWAIRPTKLSEEGSLTSHVCEISNRKEVEAAILKRSDNVRLVTWGGALVIFFWLVIRIFSR